MTQVQDAVQNWLNHNQSQDLKIQWDNPWLRVEIHRPAQRNALNGEILKHLKSVFNLIEAQPVIRGLILTGGEKYFCAGADLQEIAKIRAAGPAALIANNKMYGELLHRMQLCRVPVISAVDGPALGGGMGLVCASDFILCTDQASFGMPEPKLGIIAGQIMPYVFRKLGLVRTQEMALQGLRINGTEALRWNLVNHCFSDYAKMQSGLAELLNNILSCGPDAIAKTKVMLNQLSSVSDQEILDTAHDVVAATLSAEGVEGGMAFMAKRKPNWNQIKAMESANAC